MGRGRGFGRGRNDYFFRYGRQRPEEQKEPSPQQKNQHQEQKQDTATSAQSRIDRNAYTAQQQSRSLPGSDLSYDNTLSPEAAQRMNALPDQVKARAIEAAKPAAMSVFDKYATKSAEQGRDQEQAHEAERTQEMERGGGEEH